jgi:hypothetical protein
VAGCLRRAEWRTFDVDRGTGRFKVVEHEIAYSEFIELEPVDHVLPIEMMDPTILAADAAALLTRIEMEDPAALAEDQLRALRSSVVDFQSSDTSVGTDCTRSQVDRLGLDCRLVASVVTPAAPACHRIDHNSSGL